MKFFSMFFFFFCITNGRVAIVIFPAITEFLEVCTCVGMLCCKYFSLYILFKLS